MAITSDTPNGGTHDSDTISYTATFSEDVTGFIVSDITVSETASGGIPTVSNFAGTGTTYTFEVAVTSGDTVTVSIPKLAASDAGHNFNRASGEYTVTVLVGPPETITATITNASTPNGGTHTTTDISYIVTFDESVMDFTRTDIEVSGTASVTPAGVHNFNESGEDGLIWTFEPGCHQ